MGFKDVINRVRSVFTREKHAVEQAVELSKGMSQPQGFDFSSLYGRYGMEPLLDYLRIEQELISRFQDYNEMESYPELCLVGNTLVATTSGFSTIKELATSGKDVELLAFDADKFKFVVAKGIKPRRTMKKARVWRVTFDTGSVLEGTPNHKVMLRDGRTWKQIQELKPGDAVMPCFTKMDKDGYIRVMQPGLMNVPNTQKWVKRATLAAEYKIGGAIPSGHDVHHVDENTLNDLISNLEVLTAADHLRITARSGSGARAMWEAHPELKEVVRARCRAANARRAGKPRSKKDLDSIRRGLVIRNATNAEWRTQVSKKSPEWLAKITAKLRENSRFTLDAVKTACVGSFNTMDVAKKLDADWTSARRVLERYGLKPEFDGRNFDRKYEATSSNHKVVDVRPLAELQDVYDLTTPKYHNFVANGVVVHNSAALDIWADEATQPDVLTGRTVWVESDDVGIKKLLQSLLDQTLQIDEDIWSIARNLCKYGNNYEELLVTQEGVVGLNPLPVETVRRFEREKGLLIGFAQDPSGRFGVAADDVDKALRGDSAPPPGMAVFEPWQMAHFRLMGRSRPSTYGISILEPARWLWRRLLLLEDAALIYRLTRTPTRWIFYIDVGKLPPAQALGQIRKIKQEFTKNKFVNERGGVDLRYSPLASDENLFIPVVDGKRTTEVDLMATPEWQVMDDINYFKDKLFSAIKIPKAYLSEESDQRSRVLSLLDIRFARGVMRVQRELKNGIRKICKVHLAAIGIDPEKVNFDVFLTVPSWAYELAQIEVRNAKAEFADKVSAYLPERAIIKLIFGFSDEEIDALRKEKAEEEGGGDAGAPEEPGAEGGAEGEPKKKPDQRKTGGSPIDLPGAARVVGRETENKEYKVLIEQMEKLTKSNAKLAKKFSEIKDFSHELRSSMFFKGANNKTRMVPSFGQGRGNPNGE